jgi:acyl-coenzyme A thioesterase PaaI-like protein
MTDTPNTHLAIDRELCGSPVAVAPGAATVRLDATERMAADDRGLVHGGFVFSAADYAAMLAVNDPHVVLGAASVKLTAPVRVGDEVIVTAHRSKEEGRKHIVGVQAKVNDRVVMTGEMTAFVLDRHVLDRSG